MEKDLPETNLIYRDVSSGAIKSRKNETNNVMSFHQTTTMSCNLVLNNR